MAVMTEAMAVTTELSAPAIAEMMLPIMIQLHMNDASAKSA